MSHTRKRIHRAARFGDYTIKVIQGTVLPRLAVVFVTAPGEGEAALHSVGGFDTEAVFDRAKQWLDWWTSRDYSIKRMQVEMKFDESETR